MRQQSTVGTSRLLASLRHIKIRRCRRYGSITVTGKPPAPDLTGHPTAIIRVRPPLSPPLAANQKPKLQDDNPNNSTYMLVIIMPSSATPAGNPLPADRRAPGHRAQPACPHRTTPGSRRTPSPDPGEQRWVHGRQYHPTWHVQRRAREGLINRAGDTRSSKGPTLGVAIHSMNNSMNTSSGNPDPNPNLSLAGLIAFLATQTKCQDGLC